MQCERERKGKRDGAGGIERERESRKSGTTKTSLEIRRARLVWPRVYCLVNYCLGYLLLLLLLFLLLILFLYIYIYTFVSLLWLSLFASALARLSFRARAPLLLVWEWNISFLITTKECFFFSREFIIAISNKVAPHRTGRSERCIHVERERKDKCKCNWTQLLRNVDGECTLWLILQIRKSMEEH